MTPSRMDDELTARLLDDVRAGRPGAVEQLLAGHRDYMRAVAEVRLDRQLLARVDPSDVVQEAMLEAAGRIGDYLDRRPMPFHLWLRATTIDHVLRLRRRHVEAECRTVEAQAHLPEGSSLQLACQVLGRSPGPLDLLLRRELADGVRRALAALPADDRDVLVMRHFEGLGVAEIAGLLGIEPKAASKRYGRALVRLHEALCRLGLAGPPS